MDTLMKVHELMQKNELYYFMGNHNTKNKYFTIRFSKLTNGRGDYFEIYFGKKCKFTSKIGKFYAFNKGMDQYELLYEINKILNNK